MLQRRWTLMLVCLHAAGAPLPAAQPPTPFATLTCSSPSVPETAHRSYRLFVPEAADAAHPVPLVVYLHGAGAKGDDGQKPLQEPLVKWLAAADHQRQYPCAVLVPQCRSGQAADGRPRNWVQWANQAVTTSDQWRDSDEGASDQLRGAIAIVDEVVQRDAIDRSRVYLIGVSMGGSGAWNWAAREPRRFAAVVPICGLSEVSRAPQTAAVPVWTFHGSEDPVAPVERTRQLVDALRMTRAAVNYTEYAGVGHGIADRVARQAELWVWLFAQRREIVP
jgi:predicted peptidase